MNILTNVIINFTSVNGYPAIFVNTNNILGWIPQHITIINWCKSVWGVIFLFDTVLVCFDQIPAMISGEAHYFGKRGADDA